ncbi:glycosyltransferase [Novosphingobium sp. UBA1939]|uniref:glycosyltransferase n=1 Tax=Novosphingobium sp. UBA1939 TaxID=1946982 RepID=UPI0025E74839|nr:glycosyltransferase [Novosphingobium sp. UBA1939]
MKQKLPHQLLVDVSVIMRSDAGTGIQRVVRALLGALLDADLDGYVVRPIYATRTEPYAYVPCEAILLSGLAIATPAPVGVVSAEKGDIFLGLDLAANILPRHRRQITRWRRQGCVVATVMYDLLPEQRPRWFNPRTRRNYRRWLRVVTRCSDRIICISQEVARQLEAWIAARPWRGNGGLQVNHMRLGCDIGRTIPSKGVSAEAASLLAGWSKSRLVLVVGTIEPRKGHSCLLPAFDLLWSEPAGEDVVLVFVGRPGWRTERLQDRIRTHPMAIGSEPDRRFFWFDDASDEFLDCLYRSAHGVIVPSLAEGFGLPLVEALGHGVRVLARDLPVFRAMNLAKVSYFSQDEPVLLARAISEWLDHGDGVPALAANPVPTWRDSFGDLLSCLSIAERDNRDVKVAQNAAHGNRTNPIIDSGLT